MIRMNPAHDVKNPPGTWVNPDFQEEDRKKKDLESYSREYALPLLKQIDLFLKKDIVK